LRPTRFVDGELLTAADDALIADECGVPGNQSFDLLL
jgi:hypothetical protein